MRCCCHAGMMGERLERGKGCTVVVFTQRMYVFDDARITSGLAEKILEIY